VPPSDETLRLRWVEIGGVTSLLIDGVADAAVRIGPTGVDPAAPAAVPMAGRLERRSDDAVLFVPRFPWVPAAVYSVAAESAPGVIRRAEIRFPSRIGEPTARVTALHPGGSIVPVNVLRFYVQFSAPMSEGQAARAIRLVRDPTGEPLSDALRLLDQELWDREHRRLTVLLDPARIKRGLVANLEEGYPLVAGGAFRFEVDGSFLDAHGQPLTEPFSRRYEVGPPLQGRVDPDTWLVQPVAAPEGQRLEVGFGRPMDHALAARCLWVENAGRNVVDGEAALSEDGCYWTFTPADALAGTHRLIIDPVIEDIAGNSLLRPFDRDLHDLSDTTAQPGLRMLPLHESSASVRTG
jgi:hypothetical protein